MTGSELFSRRPAKPVLYPSGRDRPIDAADTHPSAKLADVGSIGHVEGDRRPCRQDLVSYKVHMHVLAHSRPPSLMASQAERESDAGNRRGEWVRPTRSLLMTESRLADGGVERAAMPRAAPQSADHCEYRNLFNLMQRWLRACSRRCSASPGPIRMPPRELSARETKFARGTSATTSATASWRRRGWRTAGERPHTPPVAALARPGSGGVRRDGVPR